VSAEVNESIRSQEKEKENIRKRAE